MDIVKAKEYNKLVRRYNAIVKELRGLEVAHWVDSSDKMVLMVNGVERPKPTEEEKAAKLELRQKRTEVLCAEQEALSAQMEALKKEVSQSMSEEETKKQKEKEIKNILRN